MQYFRAFTATNWVYWPILEHLPHKVLCYPFPLSVHVVLRRAVGGGTHTFGCGVGRGYSVVYILAPVLAEVGKGLSLKYSDMLA